MGLILVGGAAATFALTRSSPISPDAQPTSIAGDASADAVSADMPSKVDYRRLEARIAGLMHEPNIVGLAVGVIERGQIRLLRGYGETRVNSGDPVTPDTVFRWASLSKGVASALVVGLAEEGRLSLDAPLASMGTTLTLPGDAARVTVADVLSHRLGLVRNAWDERLEAGEDPKMLRATLGTLPAYCVPATCYSYQNIAFDAASEIVQRLAGRDYASAARARLFAPLGMKNASVGRAGLEQAASWARPHRRDKVPTTVNDSYYRVPAAGGVNSSIRDLVLWMRAQMGDTPRVLSRETLDTLHRARVPTPPHGRRGPMDRALTDAAYGLGWRSFSYAGRALVGHRGSVDGYGSLILFDPADKSGIVMLWNSNQSKAARLQLEFFDMLYGLPPTDWLELEARPKALDTGAAAASPRTAP
ncbi:serine hydrolase [Sphingomonas sp. LM7]|uniref:serine hydrolase domain-containing protein n=1 Tax=Sphingomonas sp. LM7 TaxID=1938607 RepID=UPI001558FAA0|nr:serine hydrolase domain-containing protein [Sphingomonas sp. LM7]